MGSAGVVAGAGQSAAGRQRQGVALQDGLAVADAQHFHVAQADLHDGLLVGIGRLDRGLDQARACRFEVQKTTDKSLGCHLHLASGCKPSALDLQPRGHVSVPAYFKPGILREKGAQKLQIRNPALKSQDAIEGRHCRFESRRAAVRRCTQPRLQQVNLGGQRRVLPRVLPGCLHANSRAGQVEPLGSIIGLSDDQFDAELTDDGALEDLTGDSLPGEME